MACLDIMYNHHHHHQQNSAADHPKSSSPPPMSPRISFSNDFADSGHSRQQILKPTRDYNGPVSSDFEFSVSNYSMMSADELFFKGRLLPFKNDGGAVGVGQKTTLRDELLAGEDEDDGFGGVSFRPPRASTSTSTSTRLKGFLGLRKSHIGSKKSDKNDGSRSGSGQDEARPFKTFTGNDE